MNDGGNTGHMGKSDDGVESGDVMEVEDAEEPMNVNEFEVSVQHGETMDTAAAAADAVSAVTSARRNEARQALQFSRQLIESRPTADEHLDVDSIILNCVHSAMTMIKDKDSCRGRKTSRLQLLLSLLPPEYSEQPGTRYV